MMLLVDAARARVLEAIDPLEPRSVALEDAHGAVLAEEVRAAHPLPRFDNSSMDGFAVRAADCHDASETEPVTLAVAGEVRAGSAALPEVRAGTAVRIMTGAPLPPGADAIVPVEETSERDAEVVVRGATAAGRFIRRAGEDVGEGDLLIAAGTELGAGEIAMAASAGASPVMVRGAPKVAIVVTGDELVAPSEDPGEGSIRDSNQVALAALVREAGGEPVLVGPAPDDFELLKAAFERAAGVGDVVVSTGGVAVGKYDYVKAVVEDLGRVDLWRVAMQPGKPVVLGAIGGTPFLGLPGNPVSVHVSFEQFVRPALRKMRGCSALLRPTMSARLVGALEKPPGRLHFVRVRLRPVPQGWDAIPTGPQGSHIQSSLVDCHGLVRFPVDEVRLEDGASVIVEVWRLPNEDDNDAS
ncbi:MAG: molybdopterin molybdotransferase MoeA [Actinomycetota bacterium]|nr:molybdopterin molybdotransferase MoeA [Actinomycetota bacterium]